MDQLIGPVLLALAGLGVVLVVVSVARQIVARSRREPPGGKP